MTETHDVHITAEPDANPDRCTFRVDRVLYPGTIFVSDPATAEEWVPLAKTILDVGNVRGVRINHGELLVSRSGDEVEWRELARQIGAAIRAHLQAGKEVVVPGAEDHLQGDDVLRQKAQSVIDEQLNPALAAHGGFVEIRDSKGRDLFITMGGGCQGCSAAAATMRQGVEVAIRDAVPELENIYDATDHAAGVNPFM